MSGNVYGVSLYRPQMTDLWFRKALLADPETMSYNDAWGGTILFGTERWEPWYRDWVGNPDKRFYRYVAVGPSREFVGETAWHYDEDERKYLADVIIMARCRGRGYG